MTTQATLAELAALRERVAALEATRAPGRGRGWPGPRWLGAILVLLLALLPAALGASDRFSDVPDGAFYHDDAAALADTGVTWGCGDGSIYCPDDFVTRGEMASFLARLGGLGDNAPVADAATLQGHAPGGLVRLAQGTAAGSVTLAAGDDNYHTLASVALTAPGPGFVLVTGATSFGIFSGTNFAQARYRLRDTTSGAASIEQIAHLVNLSVSNTTGATTHVFPVAAGGGRTFVLEAQHYSGASDAYGLNGEITVLFVPFGATGAAP